MVLNPHLWHDGLRNCQLPWLVYQVGQLLLQGVRPGWVIGFQSRTVGQCLLPGLQLRHEGLIAVVNGRDESVLWPWTCAEVHVLCKKGGFTCLPTRPDTCISRKSNDECCACSLLTAGQVLSISMDFK